MSEDRSRTSAGKSNCPKEPNQRKEQKNQDRKREQELERKRQEQKKLEKDHERQREQEFRNRDKRERKREKQGDTSHMQASFGETPGEMERLDLEFEQEMVKFDQKLCNLSIRAKTMATMWKVKLREKPHNADEARSRNIIAAHLTKCSGEGVFEMEPFNRAPPPLDLVTLRNKMHLTRESPCRAISLNAKKDPQPHLSQLFSSCYDGGEFLSQLPVPRDGAFFILHMSPN
nr:RNA-binding protein 25 [Drosophila bipectinata]